MLWLLSVSLVGLLLVTPRNAGCCLATEANAERGVETETGKPHEAKASLMNLGAKPEAIAFDPAKTAVIVVDRQNDFGSKGGMFDRAGIDIFGIQRAVGSTARVLSATRDLDMRLRKSGVTHLIITGCTTSICVESTVRDALSLTSIGCWGRCE